MEIPRRSLLQTSAAALASGSVLGALSTGATAAGFERGQRVRTTVDLGIHRRTDWDAPDVWVAPEGSAGYVRDGPREADGYTWYKVGFNAGHEGWCPGTYLEVAPASDGGDGGDDDADSDARTITSTIGDGENRRFTHDPTDGIRRLVLSLTGPSDGDLDLYATLDGRKPTPTNFDRRSWTFGSDERIAVDGSALDSTVGILVDAYASGRQFTLEIVEKGGGDGGDGDDGGDGGDGGSSDPTFDIGQRVTTMADLVIHEDPAIGSPSVWVADDGSDGYVRDGYLTADGYTWWNVEFNAGPQGWCVEEYLAAERAEDDEPVAPFVWPVSGEVTSGYYDTRYRRGRAVYHKSIDIGASSYTPIVAARDGVATTVTTFPSGGNAVFLSHDGGYRTEYHHMAEFGVSRGETVSQGDVVGYVGSSGRATGPHLHLELVNDSGNLVPPASEGDDVTKGDPIDREFPGL